MSKRPSLSLASLSINAPTAANTAPAAPTVVETALDEDIKISRDNDNNVSGRLQVAFRMNRDAYKELRRMALDEDTTVNALLLQGINLLRKQKGLRPLDD
jgi:hypothetical protein